METHQETSTETRPIELSKREQIVDLRGRLDTLFAKLHLASQQLIGGAQNLRESKLLLDACIEGKSCDDAPDAVGEFYQAVVEMTKHADRMTEMVEQFELCSEQVIAGAKGLV